MAERDAGLQDLVAKYREELAKLRSVQAAESGGQSQEQARRKQRSKREGAAEDSDEETADGMADEEVEE